MYISDEILDVDGAANIDILNILSAMDVLQIEFYQKIGSKVNGERELEEQI
jgi:hypothetical protein